MNLIKSNNLLFIIKCHFYLVAAERIRPVINTTRSKSKRGQATKHNMYEVLRILKIKIRLSGSSKFKDLTMISLIKNMGLRTNGLTPLSLMIQKVLEIYPTFPLTQSGKDCLKFWRNHNYSRKASLHRTLFKGI